MTEQPQAARARSPHGSVKPAASGAVGSLSNSCAPTPSSATLAASTGPTPRMSRRVSSGDVNATTRRSISQRFASDQNAPAAIAAPVAYEK